ncbi:MAG: hypothetical protein EXQ85_01270 [Alphaproteobacteria bacterium]|nr:hypothetical protein [Alphaproteobacteria bacterium]
MRHLISLVLILGSTLLAACAGTEPLGRPESDIERTWSQALVALPSPRGPVVARLGERAIQLRLGEIRGRQRLALVVFLHGCTGIGDLPFLAELARQGFAVVAPDSFARRFRPLQCDPGTLKGGQNLFVYDFRATELTYALEQIGRLDWVDYDNLFLVGASEGAVAAALFRGEVFNARVLTQWTCQGQALVRGVAAPPDEPVLAIVRAGDPYYDPRRTNDQQGDCRQFLQGRPQSSSRVLPPSDGLRGHTLLEEPTVVETISQFLRTHVKR